MGGRGTGLGGSAALGGTSAGLTCPSSPSLDTGTATRFPSNRCGPSYNYYKTISFQSFLQVHPDAKLTTNSSITAINFPFGHPFFHPHPVIIFKIFPLPISKKQQKQKNSLRMFQQSQESLSSFFFTQMLIAQHNYYRNSDEQSMQTLLRYYCDCVHYFESKQESISNYFKLKIKELVKDIRQFGNPQLASENKEKMNKKVIRAMEEQNIQEEIAKSANRQLKVNEKIQKIVEGQAESLQKRRLKRSMNKCRSVTMSFGSIDTSPETKPNTILKDEKYIESLKQFFGDGMQLVFDQEDI